MSHASPAPRRGLLLALLATAAFLTPPAAAEDAPTPGLPAGIHPVHGQPVRHSGYEGSTRPHATHVVMDAARSPTVLGLADAPTRFLDVEARGLAPWGRYALVHAPSGETVSDIAVRDGTAIFWNVPVRPGVWDLLDNGTGARLGTLVVGGRAPDVGEEIVHPVHACKNRYGTCEPHRHPHAKRSSYDGGEGERRPGGGDERPPSAVAQHPGPGWNTEQAALSYTPDVRIRTTTCWDHSLSVDAWVSGGMAATSGTGGGTYTYQRMTCFEFSSQGHPTRVRYESDFKRDVYEDHSYKVYMVGAGQNLRFEDWNIHWAKSGWTAKTSSSQPFAIEVTENGAGGVYFTGKMGWESFGVGAGTTLAANGGQQSKVRIEFFPPDSAPHQYTYRFLNGNGQTTGIIGMAWKDY